MARVEGVAEVANLLRRFEPDILKELRREFRSDLKPLAENIASRVNSEITPRLQSRDYEMFHNGRTAWGGVSGTTSVTSSSRKTLVKMVFKGTNGVGFEYAELAGIERRSPRRVSKGWYSTSVGYHSYTYAGQGKVFNDRLEKDFGGPGRFVFVNFLKKRKEIDKKGQKIADDFSQRLNRLI